jgi:hypothetical protein
VLLFTPGIGETEVNKLDLVLFHHLHHVCDGLGHQMLLKRGLKKSAKQFLVSQFLCHREAKLQLSPMPCAPPSTPT